MGNCWFALVCFVVTLTSTCGDNPLSSYDVLLGWKQLEYKFPSLQTRDRLLTNNEFIPQNNVITGIKVLGSRIFLTVPRWREGVPATLTYVDLNTTEGAKDPLLNAYPSWEMQQLGNCNAFQFTQSMEIDEYNRMWVVDVGRVNIFTNPINKCPPKLLLIDLDTDDVVHRYEFPASVVSHTTNFLNDIVVGCVTKDNCWAYISDAKDSKLVVYNLKQDKSWFVHHKSMVADPGAFGISILDGNYTFNVNIDGIALSPKDTNFERVYYSPLSSFHLYSIATSRLQDAVNGVALGEADVVSHGRRGSQSDGFAMDSQGLLFYGLLANNSVVYYNTSVGSVPASKEVLLIENDVDLQWPDTFAFDNNGYLYTVSNRLQRFATNTYDFTDVNFRVARVFTGSKSYMFSDKNKMTSTPAPVGNEGVVQTATNLDQDAPDQPVLVGLNDNNDKYKHADGSDNVSGGDGNMLGDKETHDHGHFEHSRNENKDNVDAPANSAPSTNEHLPVIIYLSVLMYPALI